MGRLTEVDESGNWSVKGLPWKKTYKGQVITNETREIIYGALCKLKDFEEICEDPKQLERIDELFLEKCREVEELKRKAKNENGFQSSSGFRICTKNILAVVIVL